MKRHSILFLFFLLTFVGYTQDYKVEKLKVKTKGNFEITRLFVYTDSVADTKIDRFIEDFNRTLKDEFEKNNLEYLCVRKGYAPVENSRFIFDVFNPDGIAMFQPAQFFTRYRGLSHKNGLFFNLSFSYRKDAVSEFTNLFTIRIGVMLDSFENAGEPAARDVFKRIKKQGYL